MRWITLLALLVSACAVDCPDYDSAECPTSSCDLKPLTPFDRDHTCWMSKTRTVCAGKVEGLVTQDSKCFAEISTGALFRDHSGPHDLGPAFRLCNADEKAASVSAPMCQ